MTATTLPDAARPSGCIVPACAARPGMAGQLWFLTHTGTTPAHPGGPARPGTGKTAPITAQPAGDGTILIDLADQTYQILRGPALDQARADAIPLYRNHWADCADTDLFRRLWARSRVGARR